MNIQAKRKQLFKNTGILAIGTLLSKTLTFFLLPIYTSYLETSDYGYVDLLQTITILLIPILSIQLYSAVFRFIIEEKEEKKINEIISTSFYINILNIIIFCILLFLYTLIFNFKNPIIFGYYLISVMLLTFLQFTIRGFGKNKLFSFISFLNTFITLALNLILIVVLKHSAISILIAFSVGNTISIIIMGLKIDIFKRIKKEYYSKEVANKLIKYSVPLIPNEISWWVANTSDRLLISKYMDLSANGIYGVANKIPVIYTTLFNVYNIAYVEAISRGIKDDNSKEFINDMYKKSIKLFSCICLGIICTMSLIFKFLIGKDYSDAYNHIYILTIAIFFNSLSSLIGSILTGYKETKTIGKTTAIGAIINIIINLVFIKKYGLYAASISTLISYIVIFIARNHKVNKIQRLEYPTKYITITILNLIIISWGYLYKITWLNIILLAYMLIFSIFTNKSIILDIIPKRKVK